MKLSLRDAPDWVIDFLSKLNDEQLGHLGSGYVLREPREGVVIDQWPPVEDILTVASCSDGFWRDCGAGVEQWVALP